MLVLGDYLELSESSTYRFDLHNVSISFSERLSLFVAVCVGGYEGDIFFPPDQSVGHYSERDLEAPPGPVRGGEAGKLSMHLL